MQHQRHLSAILFTDIVGYTAMMQKDEQQAVAVIRQYTVVLEKSVASHHGEIVNHYGDGSLCIFSSTTEAINCSIDIQQQLMHGAPAIPLRIGLHIGETFFEDGKIFGDGVNVASRIQSLGQANSILFSKEVFDTIKNQSSFKSVSLGRFDFKNVDQPIEVFGLANEGLTVPKRETMDGKLKSALPGKNKSIRQKLLAGIAIGLLVTAGFFLYSMLTRKSGFTGKEKSIAVLPFTNMSDNKENEYFSDGITEEITTQLSKISDLKVIARTSSMLYKRSTKSIKQIAEELRVSAILEGSVQKADNTIRITAQLIDANTQEHIWAEKYDREFKDVFVIQSEVAQHIANQLNAKLTKEEKIKIEKAPTNNPEAYQYYLQGNQLHNSFWETKNLEYFESSKTMFEKAIRLDPAYAMAHAGLADVYNTYTNTIRKDSVMISSQIKEIKRAWEIDSLNDYVVSVRGVIEQTTTGDKVAGFKYLKKAAELNPNNAVNLWSLALMIGPEFGLIDEAYLLFDRTTQLDPLTAANFSFRGICNFALGNADAGIKDLETAIRLEPEFIGALDALARIYATIGRLDEAKKILEQSIQLKASPTQHYQPDLAYIYAKLGNKTKALELAPDDYSVLLALGMKDAAIKAMYNDLNKGVGPPYLIFKSGLTTPDFATIKTDQRFLDIMDIHRKNYEENKKKYGVMDIIEKFSSSH